MRHGNLYEDVLIQFAAGELQCLIEQEPERMNYICKDHPIFACNLDGKTVPADGSDVCIVEAKTTALAGEWGVPGTDDVPLRVNLQVHQQMLCSGFNKAFVVVLLGGFRLHEEIYVVERNDKIIQAIIDRGEQFWNDHVLTGIPPEQNEPGDVSVFKRIVRVPEKMADVSDEDVLAWEYAKTDLIRAKKKVKGLFAEVLKQLGDAEGAALLDGRTFTYFEQNGADKIDRKALKQNYPETYAAVTTPNQFRVPRIKKA